MLSFAYVYRCLLITPPLEWHWSIHVFSSPVDVLCEASRVYSNSPIRPTCLYSRLDSSCKIYQITAPRLSRVQTDSSRDPWEGDHGWAVPFICSHVIDAYRLCQLIYGSITPTSLSTQQQQWSSHHCHDQSVFSSLWRCGISERPPIVGGFFAFKKTNLPIHQHGRIWVQFGKIHHRVQHSDLALSILRKRENCARGVLRAKRVNRNLKWSTMIGIW